MTVLLFGCAAHAQLTHLDSILAVDLGGAISQQVENKPFSIVGESGIQPILVATPHSAGVSPVVQIAGISATVALNDLKNIKDSNNTLLLVDAHGTVITPGNSIVLPWVISRTFNIVLTKRDRMLLETNQDRYVSLEQPAPKSFWASTLEPVLVVLGAAVIVALFFIIRS